MLLPTFRFSLPISRGRSPGFPRPLEQKASNTKLRLFVEKIGGEMMNARVYLMRPQTDSATVAIETEIIELLSASIQAAGGGGGGMAAMLMQAMGMGGAGGGSNAGGTTDVAATDPSGAADDGTNDQRDVEKTGGRPRELPAEFRDVLEAYFRAVEETP